MTTLNLAAREVGKTHNGHKIVVIDAIGEKHRFVEIDGEIRPYDPSIEEISITLVDENAVNEEKRHIAVSHKKATFLHTYDTVRGRGKGRKHLRLHTLAVWKKGINGWHIASAGRIDFTASDFEEHLLPLLEGLI